MNISNANKLVAALLKARIEAHLYDEGKESYSGRGMFGKQTVAVVVKAGIMGSIRDLVKATAGEDIRWDSLGHDSVVY